MQNHLRHYGKPRSSETDKRPERRAALARTCWPPADSADGKIAPHRILKLNQELTSSYYEVKDLDSQTRRCLFILSFAAFPFKSCFDSVWNQFGISLESALTQFGIGLESVFESVWKQFGIGSESALHVDNDSTSYGVFCHRVPKALNSCVIIHTKLHV